MSETVHATAVAWHGRGVLIRGASGAGKSDLALRLIGAGGLLVADDQVVLERGDAAIRALAPAALAGLLELRGVGLRRLPYLLSVPITVVIDLIPQESVERLPELTTTEVLGVVLPVIRLAPFECSVLQKLIELLRARGDF